MALQLEELGVPSLDTSFVSDNKYALGIMAWAQPMCALFLLGRTSQKCILFVEGCSRMHFQENTSMSWVCKRRVRAIRHFVCVCGFFSHCHLSWQGGVEIWIRQCLCDSKDIVVLHATARLPLSCFDRLMRAVSLKIHEKRQPRWNGGRSLVAW